MSEPTAIAKQLSRIKPIHDLSEAALEALIAVGDQRRYAPGETIVEAGRSSTAFYFVVKGSIRLVKGSSVDGNHQIIDRLHAGAGWGMNTLFTPVHHQIGALCEEADTEVVIFEKEKIESLISNNSVFALQWEKMKALYSGQAKKRLNDEGISAKFKASIQSIAQRLDRSSKKPASEEVEISRAIAPQSTFRVPLLSRLKTVFSSYPCVRQQSIMDCGPTCIAMVCRFYGKRLSVNKLREMSQVGSAGASMLNLVKTLGELGFEVDSYLSTLDQLREKTLPAIVNWKGFHWIVVYRVDEKSVVVGDPAQGLRTMSLDEFVEGWTRYTIFLRPTEAFAEIEEEIPTLKQVAHYVKPHRFSIVELFLASIAIQVFGVFLPLFNKFILDDVIANLRMDWLYPVLIGLALVIVGNALLSYLRQGLLLRISRAINFEMLKDFLRATLIRPLPFFEARKTGDITSRFLETNKITSFLTDTGLQTIVNGFTALIYLVIMVIFSVPLTLVALLFFVLHLVNLYLISPRLQNAFRDAFQKGADSESFLIESLRGLSTIKTLGVEHATRWKWDDLNTKYVNSYFKSIHFGMISNLAGSLVNNLADVAVLFAGAYLVIQGHMTIGTLIAFQMFSKSMTAPALAIIGEWDRFHETLNSLERLNDVYETQPEINESERDQKIHLPSLKGIVVFDRVTFRYVADAEQNILQNVSFDFFPGQRIGLVGRSGSGKSTLVKLLYGFYQPNNGKITVDGFNIADVWLPSLRNQIGLVNQETNLFGGTIFENIAHGRPGSSKQDVIDAAKLADAHAFVSAMPRGYDTVIEEQGKNLSGGQRQRLSIARTFLAHPRILILDEATSALDNEAERFVQQNLEKHFKDCTVIMIAHRLSTVRNADQIIVLDQGNIREMGTHQDLMQAKGLYYHFTTQQLNM